MKMHEEPTGRIRLKQTNRLPNIPIMDSVDVADFVKIQYQVRVYPEDDKTDNGWFVWRDADIVNGTESDQE